jgi:hypothetical protein
VIGVMAAPLRAIQGWAASTLHNPHAAATPRLP